MKGTDMKGHFWVSIVKSGMRILGGVACIQGDIVSLGIFLIMAEVLGIVEEIV